MKTDDRRIARGVTSCSVLENANTFALEKVALCPAVKIAHVVANICPVAPVFALLEDDI